MAKKSTVAFQPSLNTVAKLYTIKKMDSIQEKTLKMALSFIVS
jgi:hypothetical protein